MNGHFAGSKKGFPFRYKKGNFEPIENSFEIRVVKLDLLTSRAGLLTCAVVIR